MSLAFNYRGFESLNLHDYILCITVQEKKKDLPFSRRVRCSTKQHLSCITCCYMFYYYQTLWVKFPVTTAYLNIRYAKIMLLKLLIKHNGIYGNYKRMYETHTIILILIYLYVFSYYLFWQFHACIWFILVKYTHYPLFSPSPSKWAFSSS